jgi:hypothetical protein
MITAWSADGKRVIKIEGDPNHQFYVSVPAGDETTLLSPPSSGRGDLSPQGCPSPIHYSRNSGLSKAAVPLFRSQT